MSKCAFCHEREGTLNWGDALAFTHGFSRKVCEVCALTKQIEHAEERAAALPELRARLAEIAPSEPSAGVLVDGEQTA